MRFAAPVLLLLACASAPPRPGAPAPDLEPLLRAAIGHDVRSIVAEQVEVHVTGDAKLHRVISMRSASEEDLRLVADLFPPSLDPRSDELACQQWKCTITLDVAAEFPRRASYEFDASSRVHVIRLQVIDGP